MQNSFIENFDDLSFEDWLDFVFDSNREDESKEIATRWDLNADLEIFVKHCIRLFENPDFLSDRYSPEQLEGGFFNCILSSGFSLDWWIWNKENSPELRRRFIFSSINVFEKVFTKNPLEHSCFMWWDCLRDFSDDKDPKVIEWMFSALSEILKIDSFSCQMSALHGLGHIEHKEKKNLIEKFLRQNPNFEDKEYALAAIEGNVL